MSAEKELLIEYIEALQAAAKIASKLRYEDHFIKFMRIIKDSEIEILEIDFKEFEAIKDRPDPNPEPSS